MRIITSIVSVGRPAPARGARVTAHCFGEQSLRDFAAAGVDCIEHATGLVPETIESFAAQGIAIVPTLVNIDTFPAIAADAYSTQSSTSGRAAIRSKSGVRYGVGSGITGGRTEARVMAANIDPQNRDNVYVVDNNNGTIRKITPDGVVHSVTATAAWCGLRPVAKALADAEGMT